MRSVFHYFLLWVKDLVIFELRFGFLMKNFVYGQMETSGDQAVSRKIIKTKSETKRRLGIFIYFYYNPIYSFIRRSLEGLKRSGRPVRIICTYFRYNPAPWE